MFEFDERGCVLTFDDCSVGVVVIEEGPAIEDEATLLATEDIAAEPVS